MSVRSALRLDPIVQTLCARLDRFWIPHMETVKRGLAALGHPDDSWFATFTEIDEFLCTGPLPGVLAYALLSHGSAVTRPLSEFAIPELVRAAEGVIALERGMGTKVFAERALRLAPALRSDAYVGSDIDGLLPQLYRARSDCVHGKVPFLELRSLGEEGQERAAQLEYVADVLARTALLAAIRFPDRSIFETRAVLEGAWASGAFLQL